MNALPAINRLLLSTLLSRSHAHDMRDFGLLFYMLERFVLAGAAAENDDSTFSVADLGTLSAHLSHILSGNDTGCPGWDVSIKNFKLGSSLLGGSCITDVRLVLIKAIDITLIP